MSEGFHRNFRPKAAEIVAYAALVRVNDPDVYVWCCARPSGSAPGGLWGAWGLPVIPVLEPPALAAVSAWARVAGAGDGPFQWYGAGRWESPGWEDARTLGDLYLGVWFGKGSLSAPGCEGAWVPLGALLGEWEQALVYPGPVLAALARAFADGSSGGERVDLFHIAALLERLASERPGPIESLLVSPRIRVLPVRTPTLPPATHTNTVVFEGRHLVVVDPASGYPDEQERIDQVLEDAVTRGSKAGRVVLTHHHRDHVGGAVHLREKWGMPIAAHRKTAELLAGQVDVDEYLEDGDRVPWQSDAALRVLHTPGHASGHIVLLEESSGVAVLGDMVASNSTIVIDPPDGHMATYLAQLERLAALNLRLGIPAHGGVLLDPRRRLTDTARHRVWREGVICDALVRLGPQTPSQLLKPAYGDIDPRALPLALRQLGAHLDKLVEEGRVGKSSDGGYRIGQDGAGV